MLKAGKVYYYIVIVTLLLSWSPVKSLAYALPAMSLILLIIVSKKIKRILKNSFIIVALFLVYIGLLLMIGREFILQNVVLSFITYSGIFFLLVVPPPHFDNKKYIDISKIVIFVILFQAIIGIGQGLLEFIKIGTFDLSTGDAVEGTIHLNPKASGSFSNVMYASIMSFSILGVLPYVLLYDRSKLWILILGSISLVLASVVHLLLILGISILIANFIIKPKIVKKVSVVTKLVLASTIILIPILALNLLETNFSNLIPLISKTIELENPKSIVFNRVINEMSEDYVLMPYIGMGPGQFSSRASLIGTERYIGSYNNPTDLPFIEPVYTSAFGDYILDQWLYVVNLPFSAGSTLVPFSSFITVISEFGLLVFVIVVISMFRYVNSIKYISKISKQNKIMAFSNVSIITMMFLLGMQENYWELPQALFIGVIFMKLLHGKMKYSAF